MAHEPFTYELSSATQAHGEEITSLRLRPPRGEDIAACGYPFTINNLFELTDGNPNGAVPDITFHGAALIAMISRLAGVPRSTIANLPASDVWAIGHQLVVFFLPSAPATPAASSNGASTSPGSGEVTPLPSLRSA